MTNAPSACHIAVLSIHALYDTRIGNHIRSLLEGGYRVTYVNWSKDLPDVAVPSFGAARLVHQDGASAFGLNAFRFSWMLLWFFVQTCRARPTIVHLHDVLLLPLAAPLRVLCRTKLVFDIHEHYQEFPGLFGAFSRFCYVVFLPFVHGVVGVVPSTLPRSSKPSRIVPNYQRRGDFVGHETCVPSLNKAVTVVYFGSLSSLDRDLELMLGLIERVLSSTEAVCFKIGGRLYGPGAEAYGARLERLAASHPHRMQWFGEVPRERVTRESSAADIGLLLLREDSPNIRSSSPNKIFEYLSSGAAIFATDGFELAAEVRDAAGVLIAPGSSVDQVAPLLLGLCTDTACLARMKRASAELGKRYTWESVAVRYQRLYEQILAGGR